MQKKSYRVLLVALALFTTLILYEMSFPNAVVNCATIVDSTVLTVSKNTPKSTPAEATYIGNSNTKKFHRITCSEIKKIKSSNKVNLSSRDSATKGGYIPCKKCNP